MSPLRLGLLCQVKQLRSRNREMEGRDGSMTAWKDEDMREERLNDTGTEFKQRSVGRGHCQDEGEQLIFVCERFFVPSR